MNDRCIKDILAKKGLLTGLVKITFSTPIGVHDKAKIYTQLFYSDGSQRQISIPLGDIR
jgi:hypothetical protein